jgi:glycosyltransferase involved in cell wall biosynthesis
MTSSDPIRPSDEGDKEEAAPSSWVSPFEIQRFEAIWPKVQGDLLALQNVAHPLTPNGHLHYKLRQSVAAPALNLGKSLRSLLDRLPARPKHVLAVPLLGVAGGSEKITTDLIQCLKGHYQSGELCVIAPDSIFSLDPALQSDFGVPIAAMNYADPSLSPADRLELFDRLMIELRPATVHTVNSDIAWLAFTQRGQCYREDSNLFGSIYSDIRTETMAVGAFWAYLPLAIDNLAGVIADNAAVVQRATDYFTLSTSQLQKFSVLPTGLLQSASASPRPSSATGKTLWLGRIAVEKRLDVLGQIARRLPGRQFEIFGASHPSATAVDLSWLETTPNVIMRGQFASLDDILFEEFDSFVLTTTYEGKPITILEMASKGVPIVAPDVGGISEFVNESTGWLISSPDAVEEYAAAIEYIEGHPEEATRRAAAAQRLVTSHHSMESFARAVGEIPHYIARDA